MDTDHEGKVVAVKVAVMATGSVAGYTLQDLHDILAVIVLIATAIYTMLNIWFLVRDRWKKRREEREFAKYQERWSEILDDEYCNSEKESK